MRCAAWPTLMCVLWLVPGLTLGVWSADAPAPTAASRRTLVVLGDSLAAGYGVDPSESYPSVLQRWIDREKLPFEVVNAGVSGDTTAGGLRRMAWLLRRPMEVLLVALGGNDGLRGISPEATRTNLVGIIEAARARQPGIRIVLAGMQMPPNMGSNYTKAFEEIYPAVARSTRAELVPHLLEGVGGRPEMNQADLIHPTPAGHQVLASNVWAVLKPVLETAAASR
ncbi:MAG: arylesterase [Verrucomicrobiales bacterium]|nr:arylesterase [Verrucomicrobiales bacterium]